MYTGSEAHLALIQQEWGAFSLGGVDHSSPPTEETAGMPLPLFVFKEWCLIK
jgi:hypothetical protein